MKTIIPLMILALVGFQLFFRYEHWPDPKDASVVYERDTLTGRVSRIAPDQKVDFVARLLGQTGEKSEKTDPGAAPEPISLMSVGTTSDTRKATPELTAAEQAARMIESFVSRPIDLNLDGTSEEIIQSVTAKDGLLDISIVKEGRELFYARGKQLHVLPTEQSGWSDLMLSSDTGREAYFRYEPGLHAYKRLDKRP